MEVNGGYWDSEYKIGRKFQILSPLWKVFHGPARLPPSAPTSPVLHYILLFWLKKRQVFSNFQYFRLSDFKDTK